MNDGQKLKLGDTPTDANDKGLTSSMPIMMDLGFRKEDTDESKD
jgi:hypothetical protein